MIKNMMGKKVKIFFLENNRTIFLSGTLISADSKHLLLDDRKIGEMLLKRENIVKMVMNDDE